MRKDLIKPNIKSSFLSCEKDTETILRRLLIESKPYSDVLKKLLIINTKDCLTATGEKEKLMQKKIDAKNLKILLDVPYEIRKERAMLRDNITEEAFQLREKASIDYDVNKFDYVISGEEIEVGKLVKSL